MNDRPTLLRNDSEPRGNWITLKLSGKAPNVDTIGARVSIGKAPALQVAEVRSGGSYLSHNDMRVHFGLGGRTTAPAIKVRWPDGAVEWFEALKPNAIHTIRQGQGRSND